MIKDAFDRYSVFLLKKFGLQNRFRLVKRLAKILFKEIDDDFLLRNQKFDFSISPKSNKFRFSFNDFGERRTSYEKYISFFREFKDNCNEFLINDILKSMNPHIHHQTTIGVEIGEDRKEDRIKLYFEDFEYDSEEIRSRLKNLLKLLNINKSEVFKEIKDYPINMVCIDFFYEHRVELKVYTTHNDLKPFLSEKKIKKFQDAFPPVIGGFYLVTFRFNSNSNLVPRKIYRIFNIIKYAHFRKKNIYDILNAIKYTDKDLVNIMHDSIGFLRKNNIKLNPVAFSEDININKKDVYFTLIPQK